MAWRGVHLTEPAWLSVERGALRIAQKGKDPVTIPLEDLGWLIVDTLQATLTSRLLADCAANGVCVIISDERHLPASVIVPKSQYHRQLTTVEAQVDAGRALKGRIWQTIVRQKIINQAAVLNSRAVDDDETRGAVKALRAMADRVRQSDPDNVEALAAQTYWPRLFSGFTRRNENDVRNAWLNYGYAIVRALLARELAALGFELSLGVHHSSALNPHNLVDDLLEPFRPVVDGYVWEYFSNNPEAGREDQKFTKESRQILVAIPSRQILLSGERISVMNAASQIAAGLRASLIDRFPDALNLPKPM